MQSRPSAAHRRSAPEALIALGANLPSTQGDPAETLEAALALIAARGIEVIGRSAWYASPAWPAGSGPDYVNGAARLSALLSPHDLMQALHRVETMLGRRREGTERWQARPCDIDLIAHGSAVIPGLEAWRRVAAAAPETPRPGLCLPHPLMHERAFVLVPLAEIAPAWRHPVRGETVGTMLAALPEKERKAVRRLAGDAGDTT